MSGVSTGKPISRREFLRVAGKTGAALGLGAGLTGLVGACEEPEASSNTIATIVVGPTTTTLPQPTTTVSTSPEVGRSIRIGLVSAKTGPLALFGKADEWWIDYAQRVLHDGLLCGDGRLHELVFLVKDSGSDPERAREAAGELILTGNADILMCSGAAGMVNPIAALAEALECPLLSSFVEWRQFVFDRGGTLETRFKWTYAHAIALEDITGNYMAMWSQSETNRKIGFVFADDAEGLTWTDATAGLPAAAAAAGYESVLPGLYPVATEDFSAHIAAFRENGCEICCGAMPTTDLVTFWKQAVQLDYRPKVVTMGGALLFPAAVEALGAGARNMTTEGLWHPSWPYRDSITGKSARELADDYQEATGEQWTAAIAQYAKLEWAVDVLKRVRDVDSKEALIARVRTTRLDTCLGRLDFTVPVDTTDLSKSKRPVENVYKAPVAGVQWVQGKGFDFQPDIVANVNSRDLPVAARTQPMAYASE
jgi:branched-chain amino acid transport system substrate-binding protein